MTAEKQSMTILNVVMAVQDTAGTDEEVVAILSHLINTRRMLRRCQPATARAH